MKPPRIVQVLLGVVILCAYAGSVLGADASGGGANAGAQPASASAALEPAPDRLIFRPYIADPRTPHFSGAWHFYAGDKELRNVGSANFGETFVTLPRPAAFDGVWQLGLQPAVFAIFDMDAASSDLINADYLIGVPVFYRKDDLAIRGRLFHQSSHLGDEYLLREKHEDYANLSYEAVDIQLSYFLSESFRVYGGGGYIVRRDPSGIEPWFTQGGVEFTQDMGFKLWNQGVSYVFAADAQNEQETRWRTNLSLRTGLQLEPAAGRTAKWQLLVEYYNGYSPNGLFYDRVIEYHGLGLHYYF